MVVMQTCLRADSLPLTAHRLAHRYCTLRTMTLTDTSREHDHDHEEGWGRTRAGTSFERSTCLNGERTHWSAAPAPAPGTVELRTSPSIDFYQYLCGGSAWSWGV